MRTDWKRFLRSVACCLVPVLGLVVGIQDFASAQSGGGSVGSMISFPLVGSFEPLTTFEKFCGPILPKCGIGNTFRSEFGTGYGLSTILTAKLTQGSGDLDLDLRAFSALDNAPVYTDVRADLRLWRFGFRSYYYYFDNKSVNHRLAKLTWSGARLGLDLDAVQHEWLTFGACIDWYLANPSFNGNFFTTYIPLPNQPLPDGTIGTAWSLGGLKSIDVTGSKPWTWGLYLRYMPPAILGMPVHFDAYYNLPLAGSQYTSYGAALVFRPQIYRFDLACKLGFDWSHLKFSNAATTIDLTTGTSSSANRELDMEWQMGKVELAVYF